MNAIAARKGPVVVEYVKMKVCSSGRGSSSCIRSVSVHAV
jgi:hypothetical protein